ncbi:MAG: MgtC/SapB family protein [Clostridia bacterium]|nr:MgtC/SapB family protein [Clostridia bacterium]
MNDPIANLLGTWAAEEGIGAVLFRIALSLLLSAVLGCERSGKRHAAGLRTFIIVSLGGTVVTLFDVFLMKGLGLGFPLLSAAAVVAVAILSANSVLFSSRSQIKGLTTSVALWAVATLGMALGAGLYTVALVGFLALMATLSYFPAFESYLKNRSNHFEIHLELANKANLAEFITTIRRLGLRIDEIESNPAYLNSGLSVYSIGLTVQSPELKRYKTHAEIIAALATVEYVSHIEEMN